MGLTAPQMQFTKCPGQIIGPMLYIDLNTNGEQLWHLLRGSWLRHERCNKAGLVVIPRGTGTGCTLMMKVGPAVGPDDHMPINEINVTFTANGTCTLSVTTNGTEAQMVGKWFGREVTEMHDAITVC